MVYQVLAKCIGVGTGGGGHPPIFWVTYTNIIPVPPQSDKIDCRLLKESRSYSSNHLKLADE